ncbi:MAG: hypothetical protein PHI24_08935 [Desulfitobacteriaceae bacterium]|nr:hypothetical protein [Desulfitobacteriaceae bacterium]
MLKKPRKYPNNGKGRQLDLLSAHQITHGSYNVPMGMRLKGILFFLVIILVPLIRQWQVFMPVIIG